MEIEVLKKSVNSLNEQTMSLLRKKELNVAAYARASTDNDDQQFSFNSQQKYYYNKIGQNKNWFFVGVYADEGISGTQTKKRKNFMKLIRDALNGKIDLILTKSISRFARNTVDTLHYVRMLKEKNVGVYFEEENINTLDMAGELLLTILCSIAQQEVENLSSHVTLGLKMKMQQGEMVGFCGCYGYTYDNEKKQIFINPKQADIVKKIYELFLKGNSLHKISQYLEDNNVITYRGNSTWNPISIKEILTNEKYTGDLLIGKQYTIDSLTHKSVKNKGEKDMYLVKNHHEAIISKDDFEKVQEILQDTKEKYKTFFKIDPQTRYAFSGILKCGFCGNSLKRKCANKAKTPKYCCKLNLVSSRVSCLENKSINEEIIQKIFMQTMIKLRKKIKLENNFNNQINSQISYARRILLNKDSINEEEFDSELFDKLINYAIIGGYDENNNSEPYMIRFILKTEDSFYINSETTKETIINENKVNQNNSKLYKIVDFMSKQKFFCYEKNEENKLCRKPVERIRVTVEIDSGKGGNNGG